MKEKTCFKCNVTKQLSEFYVHKQMFDGHLNKCKECTKLDIKQNLLKNKDYYRKYDLKRYRYNLKRLKDHKYRGIVGRCNGGHSGRKYKVEGMSYLTREEYDSWWTNNILDFLECFKVWELSGFRNKFAPSIDRIDNSKGYTPENMQWLLLTDNSRKR